MNFWIPFTNKNLIIAYGSVRWVNFPKFPLFCNFKFDRKLNAMFDTDLTQLSLVFPFSLPFLTFSFSRPFSFTFPLLTFSFSPFLPVLLSPFPSFSPLPFYSFSLLSFASFFFSIPLLLSFLVLPSPFLAFSCPLYLLIFIYPFPPGRFSCTSTLVIRWQEKTWLKTAMKF